MPSHTICRLWRATAKGREGDGRCQAQGQAGGRACANARLTFRRGLQLCALVAQLEDALAHLLHKARRAACRVHASGGGGGGRACERVSVGGLSGVHGCTADGWEGGRHARTRQARIHSLLLGLEECSHCGVGGCTGEGGARGRGGANSTAHTLSSWLAGRRCGGACGHTCPAPHEQQQQQQRLTGWRAHQQLVHALLQAPQRLARAEGPALEPSCAAQLHATCGGRPAGVGGRLGERRRGAAKTQLQPPPPLTFFRVVSWRPRQSATCLSGMSSWPCSSVHGRVGGGGEREGDAMGVRASGCSAKAAPQRGSRAVHAGRLPARTLASMRLRSAWPSTMHPSSASGGGVTSTTRGVEGGGLVSRLRRRVGAPPPHARFLHLTGATPSADGGRLGVGGCAGLGPCSASSLGSSSSSSSSPPRPPSLGARLRRARSPAAMSHPAIPSTWHEAGASPSVQNSAFMTGRGGGNGGSARAAFSAAMHRAGSTGGSKWPPSCCSGRAPCASAACAHRPASSAGSGRRGGGGGEGMPTSSVSHESV